MQLEIPNVGAPDPELKTSPILDIDEEEETLDAELETCRAAARCTNRQSSSPLREHQVACTETVAKICCHCSKRAGFTRW